MKREFLENLQIPSDAIGAILAEHEKGIKEHKNASATLKSENDELRATIAERDKELGFLQDFSGSNADLKQKIVELEEQNKATISGYEAKLDKTTLSGKLDLALTKSGAIDLDLVKTKLDMCAFPSALGLSAIVSQVGAIFTWVTAVDSIQNACARFIPKTYWK